MKRWEVLQTDDFREWFDASDQRLQEDVVGTVELLAQFGPLLARPYADTIKGSVLKNLKELRIRSREREIRVFYIFDTERKAVLLIGGNKASSQDKNFYSRMIKTCEKIYSHFQKSRD